MKNLPIVNLFSKCLCLILSFAAINAFGNLSNETLKEIQQLNDDYKAVSALSLHELAERTPEFKSGATDLKALAVAVKNADEKNNPSLADGLIVGNITLIKQHINAEDVQGLVAILLKHHTQGIAEELLEAASTTGNDFAQARIKFELAKFAAHNNDWQQASALLKSINIANNLHAADADEANIILGTALQHQKKHRLSLEFYGRIKPESPHYRIAQLNTAVAYIRQDWWTDAHIAINNALAVEPKVNDELTNRLYTVLGFSQLQQGFYRAARDTFKHVYIKSSYANRALLGLGMAAMHQEDFVGALNAFDHLKQKTDQDASVAESYLMSAFTVDKLNQKETAAGRFTEAIAYYEGRFNYYSKQVDDLAAIKKSQGTQSMTQVYALTAEADTNQSNLQQLKEKMEYLNRLLSYQPSAKNQQAITRLMGAIYVVYIDSAKDFYTDKQNAMNTYLSQSRFGLARIYDSK